MEAHKLAPPEDLPMQTYITNLLTEKYELSDNWKRFLGRPVLKPEENYKDEIDSVLSHFKLRKVMHLIKENQKDLIEAKGEDEVNTLLQVHTYLTEIKKKVIKDIGGSLL